MIPNRLVVHDGMATPWGIADYVGHIAEGIGVVGTPSHGGIKLSSERQKQMPEYLRTDDGWYEEDCEWCLPFAVFEDAILAGGDASAIKGIRNGLHKITFARWHGDKYKRFYKTEEG